MSSYAEFLDRALAETNDIDLAFLAADMAFAEQGESLEDIVLGMLKGEWHGPKPPSPDWVLVRTGARGGKIWRPPSGESKPRQEQPQATAERQQALQEAVAQPVEQAPLEAQPVEQAPLEQKSAQAALPLRENEIDSWLSQNNLANWQDRLTPEENQVVKDWQTAATLNMRILEDDIWPEDQVAIDLMDNAIAKGQINTPVTVFRAFKSAQIAAEAKPGMTIQHKTYPSTSLSREYIYGNDKERGFFGYDSQENIVFELQLAPGSHAAYPKARDRYAHEKELLLPRGGTIVIKEVIPYGQGKRIIGEYREAEKQFSVDAVLEHYEDYQDMSFGMLKGEWHGPKPPSPDWVLVRTGARGGKVWRPPSGGMAFAQEEWSSFEGPRGGRGWRNSRTGEVLYQEEKPGTEGTAPGRPEARTTASVEGAVWDSVKRIYPKFEERLNRTGQLIKIPELYDAIKQENKSLTPQDFHKLLLKWQLEDSLTLQVANDPQHEPRGSEGIPSKRGVYFYVDINPEQLAATKGQEQQKATASPEQHVAMQKQVIDSIQGLNPEELQQVAALLQKMQKQRAAPSAKAAQPPIDTEKVAKHSQAINLLAEASINPELDFGYVDSFVDRVIKPLSNHEAAAVAKEVFKIRVKSKPEAIREIKRIIHGRIGSWHRIQPISQAPVPEKNKQALQELQKINAQFSTNEESDPIPETTDTVIDLAGEGGPGSTVGDFAPEPKEKKTPMRPSRRKSRRLSRSKKKKGH